MRVATALGELEQAVQKQEAAIAITGSLRDFLEVFEWQSGGRSAALLNEVYRYCSLLFLFEAPGVVMLSLGVAKGQIPFSPHPAPADATEGALVDYWCEELGIVFSLHESARTPGSAPFIAIACTSQFAGEPSPGYESEGADHFDLVGPRDLGRLGNALAWDVPAEAASQKIRFADAYRNLPVIGCVGIDNPSGGSHYKAHFPGKRPWILDPNNDPVPDRFLGELEPITGLPTSVVKFALKNGRLPPRRLRI